MLVLGSQVQRGHWSSLTSHPEVSFQYSERPCLKKFGGAVVEDTKCQPVLSIHRDTHVCTYLHTHLHTHKYINTYIQTYKIKNLKDGPHNLYIKISYPCTRYS